MRSVGIDRPSPEWEGGANRWPGENCVEAQTGEVRTGIPSHLDINRSDKLAIQCAKCADVKCNSRKGFQQMRNKRKVLDRLVNSR